MSFLFVSNCDHQRPYDHQGFIVMLYCLAASYCLLLLFTICSLWTRKAEQDRFLHALRLFFTVINEVINVIKWLLTKMFLIISWRAIFSYMTRNFSEPGVQLMYFSVKALYAMDFRIIWWMTMGYRIMSDIKLIVFLA